MDKNYILNYNNGEKTLVFSTDAKNVKLIKQVIPAVAEWKLGKVFEGDDREYNMLTFLKKPGILQNEVDVTVTEGDNNAIHLELDVPNVNSADLWGVKIDQTWGAGTGTPYILKASNGYAVVNLTTDQVALIENDNNYGLNGTDEKVTKGTLTVDDYTLPGYKWTYSNIDKGSLSVMCILIWKQYEYRKNLTAIAGIVNNAVTLEAIKDKPVVM